MAQKRVLIVDDALIMRKRIMEIAEQAGHRFVPPNNSGIAAIRIAVPERFRAVPPVTRGAYSAPSSTLSASIE